MNGSKKIRKTTYKNYFNKKLKIRYYQNNVFAKMYLNKIFKLNKNLYFLLFLNIKKFIKKKIEKLLWELARSERFILFGWQIERKLWS